MKGDNSQTNPRQIVKIGMRKSFLKIFYLHSFLLWNQSAIQAAVAKKSMTKLCNVNAHFYIMGIGLVLRVYINNDASW